MTSTSLTGTAHLRVNRSLLEGLDRVEAKSTSEVLPATETQTNKSLSKINLLGLDLENIVDKLIMGNECSRPKPYPDPYLETIKYFNFNNNKVIIFEDSKSGLLSATSSNVRNVIGIKTIFN